MNYIFDEQQRTPLCEIMCRYGSDKGTLNKHNYTTFYYNIFKNRCHDKLRIFEVVEQSIGFEQINKMVFEQLRKWVIDTTYNALSIEINDDKKATLQMILAEIYRGQGLYSKSEELYLICLEKRLEIYGDMNEDTLKTMNGLGISLFSQCKYIEAEEKFIECLKKRKTLKGDANRETLQSLSNLAGLYLRQKKTKLAESLYLEVLTKRKVYLGEEDEDTLHSMNTLANTYVQLNKQNEAEILFMDVLQKYQNIFRPILPTKYPPVPAKPKLLLVGLSYMNCYLSSVGPGSFLLKTEILT
jgi:tetratricopeptide (TPR) repeat protein